MSDNIELENRYLSKLKSKHDTEQKDAVKTGKKKIHVENLLEDVNNAPEKVFVMGPVAHGVPSNKPAKKDENPEHGGAGKEMM